jgi:response regulator RpfG family c-di-GMP phosphodiesterase
MTERILLVDDDANILQGYQRALRKQFVLEPALSGEEGLEAIRTQGPYAVTVADMRMPGMNGVEFLARVKEIAPDTVRMMLTGNADQQTALDAVNQGHIFRFLTKPCSSELMAKMLEAGLEQYRLIMAERDLLVKTLRGSVQVLTDVLSLINPAAFARASRVRGIVTQINKELQTEKSWLIEIAAMLSQIGCVAVPEHILNKVVRNEPLTVNERKTYEGHAEIARSLLSHIPRLEDVAEIIAHQNDDCASENDHSNSRSTKTIPFGSRILKVALDYDASISNGLDKYLVLAEMNDHKTRYDPMVLGALRQVLHVSTEYVIREVSIQTLTDGSTLADDIYSIKGTLLCSKGQEVTRSMRARLKNYIFNVGIRGPIKIFVTSEEARDMPESSESPAKMSSEDIRPIGNDFINSLGELGFDESQ